MHRILAVVVTVAVVVGLGVIAARQYAAKEVAQAAQESVKEAVSEAVQQRKADLKADASVASENRVRVDSVRAVTRKAKEKLRDPQSEGKSVPARDYPVVDPEFDRLLNDAIDASNRAVESARRLSH